MGWMSTCLSCGSKILLFSLIQLKLENHRRFLSTGIHQQNYCCFAVSMLLCINAASSTLMRLLWEILLL